MACGVTECMVVFVHVKKPTRNKVRDTLVVPTVRIPKKKNVDDGSFFELTDDDVVKFGMVQWSARLVFRGVRKQQLCCTT